MKKTNAKLLKSLKLGDEILEYVDSEKEVVINGERVDLNFTIFDPKNYPFDMSFDELQYELHYSDKVEDELANKYIEYVNNTLKPIYEKCRENEVNKIYFAKLRTFKTLPTSISITEYCIKKVTEKRVYYYENFDKHSTEEDVKFVDKNKFGTYDVILENGIVATTWFSDSETEDVKDIAINGLKNAIKEELNKHMDKMSSLNVTEKTSIAIK